MTKRVNWLPNLRVDVTDMRSGTTDLSTGLSSQFINQFILDNFARIASGFRVQIPDQTLTPGQFTIYNGIAFDRSGQLLQNEDQENASRSYTLLANAQYFVEVQFVTDQSNLDARAFWDPTVDNGVLPSGDPRLPGQEFAQNVATRISPDWNIVTPVSTTGFAINSDPTSTKIPVAVLNVVAGVISGATVVNAKTVLANAVAAGVSTIKVVDSKVFPDAFAATVDSEAITVTANDRANGVLTLSAILTLPHTVGARVVITGAGLSNFLVDRSAAALPTSGSADARPKFWQADEERGYALSQDPTTAAGRSDSNIEALKDQVDFLAAQVRELRWGASRAADLGKTAPPSSFSAAPRYYEVAGGVEGARSVTYTIGDGVASWGDFNVLQEGSFFDAFSAAFNSLPLAGGRIHIKRSASPYTISAFGIALFGGGSGTVIISGEGQENTIIKVLGATPAFTITNSFNLVMYDLAITRDAAATAVDVITVSGASTASTMFITNCSIAGLGAVAGDATTLSGKFTNVNFTAGAGSNGCGLKGDFLNATFENCTFASILAGVGSRAILSLGAGSGTRNTKFSNCIITTPTSATYGLEFLDTTIAPSGVIIDHCTFSGSNTAIGLDNNKVAANANISITNCIYSGAGRFLYVDNITDLLISNCVVSTSNSNEICYWIDSSANNARIKIVDCEVTQLSAVNSSGRGVLVGYAANSVIRGLVGINCDIMLLISDCFNLSITECKHICANGFGHSSIEIDNGSDVHISDCDFKNLTDATRQNTGILLNNTDENFTIRNCNFINIGTTTSAGETYGIYINTSGTTAINYTISNCNFKDLNCVVASYGVFVDDRIYNLSINGCNFYNIGLNTSSLTVKCINLHNGHNISIANNNFQNVGNSTHPQYAIMFETGSTGSDTYNVSVIGNNIYSVDTNSSGHGFIYFYNVGQHLTITNNTIQTINNFSVGIEIGVDNVLYQDLVRDFCIKGNIIGSNDAAFLNIGIRLVIMSDDTVITDNIIRGFRSQGIYILGNTVEVENVVINNNFIRSDYDTTPTQSIYVENITDFVICGNVLKNTSDNGGAGDFKKALALVTCTNGVINGNFTLLGKILAGTPTGPNTGAHVYIFAGVCITISGNQFTNIVTTGTGYGVLTAHLSASSSVSVISNHFFNFGTAIIIDGNPAVPNHRALKSLLNAPNINAGTQVDPIALGGIDMNHNET